MLTQFEQSLLDKFLDGDHPVLATLRAQAATATVADRDFSPVGVNAYLAVSSAAPRTSRRSFDLTDVAFQFEGAENPGHAVLMVRDGMLHELMVYNWTDVWPARPGLVLKWMKYVAFGPKGTSGQPTDHRDMASLAKELAA
jgi:hypothetical protein